MDQASGCNPSHQQATFTSKDKVGKGMLYHMQQNIKASCSVRAFILLVNRGMKMVWKYAIYEFKILTISKCAHCLKFAQPNILSMIIQDHYFV
jgi:hypothetical protein